MELAQTLCAGSTGIKQQLETQILVYGGQLTCPAGDMA